VGLCYWLWRQTNAEAAAKVEQELKRVGIPSELCACKLCDGRSMLGGIAQHLLTPSHVRNVATAADLSLQTPGGVAEVEQMDKLSQSWDVPAGHVVLHHLPLKVSVSEEGAPPAATAQPSMQPMAPMVASNGATDAGHTEQTQATHWKRSQHQGRSYWGRSDGAHWFWEDDCAGQGWKKFTTGFPGGEYFWNERTGNWFLEATGEDKGIWHAE